jgi:hypothetical protein
MTGWLALDLSLSSTGFAFWQSDSERAVIGHWKLADKMKWRAGGFVRLHKHLLEIHRETSIDHIVYEEPLSQASLTGRSNIETIETQVGLAAHVQSFAAAVKATETQIHQATWRRHFVGVIPRGTKRVDLKAMAFKRARELGFDPACDDESDALGLLDFMLSTNGVLPPWRREAILVREMTPAGDGKRALL